MRTGEAGYLQAETCRNSALRVVKRLEVDDSVFGASTLEVLIAFPQTLARSDIKRRMRSWDLWVGIELYHGPAAGVVDVQLYTPTLLW